MARLYNVISKDPGEEKYHTIGSIWENTSASGKTYKSLSLNVEEVKKELAKEKNAGKEWATVGIVVDYTPFDPDQQSLGAKQAKKPAKQEKSEEPEEDEFNVEELE